MASTEAFGFGFTVELLQKDLDRLQGAENGRRITIAFFCLTVYDWLLTLNSEVRASFRLLGLAFISFPSMSANVS